MLNQLETVRKDGIAWEREESTDQVCCWAIPLYRGGQIFASLSVSVPLFRCSDQKESLVLNSLFKAKQEIELFADTQSFALESV